MIDFEEDAAVSAADKAKVILRRVATLAEEQELAQRKVTEAEDALKKAKAALFKIESVDMPELLREAGLTEIVLANGARVEVKDEISCSITEAKAHECMRWLRAHGFGGIIKTSVSVTFGKDEIELADKLALQLVKKFGAENVLEKEAVHPSTLKSFIKERIAASAEADPSKPIAVPPYDLFGVQPFSIAKVTRPKGKR